LQQYKNIKLNTDLQVEEYYGSKGVDTWNLKSWQKEISDNDVCLSFPENYFRLPLFIGDFTFMIWSIDCSLGLMDFLTLELMINLFLNLWLNYALFE
jgi:hypothetical protein